MSIPTLLKKTSYYEHIYKCLNCYSYLENAATYKFCPICGIKFTDYKIVRGKKYRDEPKYRTDRIQFNIDLLVTVMEVPKLIYTGKSLNAVQRLKQEKGKENYEKMKQVFKNFSYQLKIAK